MEFTEANLARVAPGKAQIASRVNFVRLQRVDENSEVVAETKPEPLDFRDMSTFCCQLRGKNPPAYPPVRS